MRKQLMLAVSSVAIFQNTFSMTGAKFVECLQDHAKFKEHSDEIRVDLQNGNIPLTSLATNGITVKDVELSGLKFVKGNDGITFNGTKFINVKFVSTDLSFCNFSSCSFEKCDFSSATLKGRTARDAFPSHVTDCKFIDCNFSDADLTNCWFENTTMDKDCEIERVKLNEYVYQEQTSVTNPWKLHCTNYNWNTNQGAKNLIEDAIVWRLNSADGEKLRKNSQGGRPDGLDNDYQARKISARTIGHFVGCLRLNLENAVLGDKQRGFDSNYRYDLTEVVLNNANLKNATLVNPQMRNGVIGVNTDINGLQVVGNYWELSNTQIGTIKIDGSCWKNSANGTSSGVDKLYTAQQNCQDEPTKQLIGKIISAFCRNAY